MTIGTIQEKLNFTIECCRENIDDEAKSLISRAERLAKILTEMVARDRSAFGNERVAESLFNTVEDEVRWMKKSMDYMKEKAVEVGSLRRFVEK